MKKISKILLGIFIAIVLLLAGLFLYIRNDVNSPSSKDSQKIVFEIEKGKGNMAIIEALKEKGLVKNVWTTAIYLKISGNSSKLKAGTFLLDKANSPARNIDIIVSGEAAIKKITLLEGWTMQDMAKYLDDKGVASKKDFLAAAEKTWDYSFLPKAGIEGYLYPDTYYIKYNASGDDIVKILLENFEKKLTPSMRDEIKKQGRSIEDIVILASIVEKEVSKESDRKIVAGIFLSRMKEGMALQADSTINYITGDDNPTPTYEDLRSDSPYNTYTYKGLPPGPICNPSISSIMAAIYPEITDYRYYLNRQDTMETVFAKSYEDHLANKQKYLK